MVGVRRNRSEGKNYHIDFVIRLRIETGVSSAELIFASSSLAEEEHETRPHEHTCSYLISGPKLDLLFTENLARMTECVPAKSQCPLVDFPEHPTDARVRVAASPEIGRASCRERVCLYV